MNQTFYIKDATLTRKQAVSSLSGNRENIASSLVYFYKSTLRGQDLWGRGRPLLCAVDVKHLSRSDPRGFEHRIVVFCQNKRANRSNCMFERTSWKIICFIMKACVIILLRFPSSNMILFSLNVLFFLKLIHFTFIYILFSKIINLSNLKL